MPLIADPSQTTTFISAQKADDKAVFEPGAITTRPATKTATKCAYQATDELFSGSHVPESNEVIEKVVSIMQRHGKILSTTRRGTKTMEATFLRLEQIQRGEFLYAYTWDKNWWERVSSAYPVKDVRFAGLDELLARIDDVLGYVEERQNYGYWYPSKRNGRSERVSLSNFLAAPMKNGNWWSPFLEIACGDCVTPKMYRNALGEKTCAILDRVLEKVWFRMDFQTMCRFYQGVLRLKRWHLENLDGLLLRCNENSYHLSSFSAMLERVAQCNEETGCVGPAFIGPWSSRWCVLKDWFKNVHGVLI